MTSALAVILFLACSQALAQDYNLFYRHPRNPSLPASSPPFEQLPYGERYVVQHATMVAGDGEHKVSAIQQHTEIEEVNGDDYEYYYQPNQPIQTVNVVQPVQPAPVVRIEPSTPDIYRNICPCKPVAECARPYGIGIFDIRDFGAIGPCREYGLVRCCGNPLPTLAPEAEIMRIPAQEQKYDNELNGNSATATGYGNQPMAPEHVEAPVAPSGDENAKHSTKVEMIYYTPQAQEAVTEVKVPAKQSGVTVHQAYQQAAYHKQQTSAKIEPSYQKHHQTEHVQIFPLTGSQVEATGPSSNSEHFATIKEMTNNEYQIDTPVLPPSKPGQTPMHVQYEIPHTPKDQRPAKAPESVPAPQYNKPTTKSEYNPPMQPNVVPAPSVVHDSYSEATTTTTTTTTPAPVVYETPTTVKPRPVYRHNVKHQMKHPNIKYGKAPHHAPVSHDSSATTERSATITIPATESPLSLPILEPIVEDPNTLMGASVSVSSSVPGSPAFASVSVSSSLPLEHRNEAQQTFADKPAEKHEPQYAAVSAPTDFVAGSATQASCNKHEEYATAPTTTQAPATTTGKGSVVEYGGFQPMKPYHATQGKVETSAAIAPVTATTAPAAETQKNVPQEPLTIPQPLPTYGQSMTLVPMNPVPAYHQAPVQQVPQYSQPQRYPTAPVFAPSHPSQAYAGTAPVPMHVPRAQYSQYPAQPAYHAAPAPQRPVYYQRPQQTAAYQPKPQMHVPRPAFPQVPMASPYSMPKQQPVAAKPYVQKARPAY